MTPDIKEFKTRRDKALRELDMDYAREMLPHASNDEVRLLALHKARYECTSIEDHFRLESKAWLREHHCGGIRAPLLPGDELPK